MMGDGNVGFTNLRKNITLLLTECSIRSSGNNSYVVGDDHFTEYSMTSEHHGDITVQTEAESYCYQIRLDLNCEENKPKGLKVAKKGQMAYKAQ